jgi:hypothetical protein
MVNKCFARFQGRAPLTNINKLINHWLWGQNTSLGTLLRNMEGGSITRDFEKKVNY